MRQARAPGPVRVRSSRMHFIFDLLQGIGIAAAIGIRPFLPTLLAGALAAANLGLDFDHTRFSFLEGVPFLLVILVLVAAFAVLERRRRPDTEGAGTGPFAAALLGVALVLGALLACGSLDDRSSTWWPGLIAGPLAVGLAYAATRSLLGRVRRRLDAQTAGALPLYAEGAALLAAGLSILLPPLAILVVGALAWLLVAGRRRAERKYAGLRILR